MITMKGLKGLSMVDCMTQGVERTFVIFSSTETTRWYNRFLKKGFNHTWVLHYDGYFWSKHSHDYNGLNYELLTQLDGFRFDQSQNISRYFTQLKDTTILEVDRDYLIERCGDKTRSKFLIVGSTCVEFVKDFTCCREWWAHTPYQLYKHLIKSKVGYGLL